MISDEQLAADEQLCKPVLPPWEADNNIFKAGHKLPEYIAEVRRLLDERGIYCAGCGQRITQEMDAEKRVEAVAAHIDQCQSHPMHQMAADLMAAEAERDRLRTQIERLRRYVPVSAMIAEEAAAEAATKKG